MFAKYQRMRWRFTAALALLLTPWSSAHELSENRATMVLRDQNHVALTLYLNYAEVLHQTLAPEQRFSEFVLAFAALPPEQCAAQLRAVQARFQAQIKVLPRPAIDATLQSWEWPAAARVQALLRDRAMQMLTAPNEHAHDTALEVRVSLKTAARVSAVSALFPLEWGRVLVVSYRPNQTWAEPTEAATEIKFN